ncbi:sensor histidine kinase [Pseudoalteromonas umbrosa]|uniref:sensor histidine kinase n=1 Tax=Pseudoalteromonas umbrosa TaxID=3048489 RepID=UPI0024C386FB|nr:HAMP domain-containing sensor histidine kinase [Pseudoalteromonas sp. B95]MDK1288439.1 HAMP domain-containing sensor histidine kinase [Pseudoalteromonas sp. B95]
MAIGTLAFALSYPLVWGARQIYLFWRQSIIQLALYAQSVKDGEQNIHLRQRVGDGLLYDLQKEIYLLAEASLARLKQGQTLNCVISQILDSWPVPVCLFDQDLKLTYRNATMNALIHQPMLVGQMAKELGFIKRNAKFYHPKFDDKWQSQTIRFIHQGHKHWLFSAVDISQVLRQKKSITQQNLVRVLGHELRNSLTPMSSMTDTLLASKQLDESATRLVLTRINQRSNRLLSFVDEYSRLAQLPPVKCDWFDINTLIDEVRTIIDESKVVITFQGNEQCFGDLGQLIQVLINLVKNAKEACEETISEVSIKAFCHQQKQTIIISDNGPGFSNLNNVLTPFYTTKKEGSGIGLSLCNEIVCNHNGYMEVANHQTKGAKITLVWPIMNLNNNCSSPQNRT